MINSLPALGFSFRCAHIYTKDEGLHQLCLYYASVTSDKKQNQQEQREEQQ